MALLEGGEGVHVGALAVEVDGEDGFDGRAGVGVEDGFDGGGGEVEGERGRCRRGGGGLRSGGWR